MSNIGNINVTERQLLPFSVVEMAYTVALPTANA